MTRASRILLRFRRRDKPKIGKGVHRLFALLAPSQPAVTNRFLHYKAAGFCGHESEQSVVLNQNDRMITLSAQ